MSNKDSQFDKHSGILESDSPNAKSLILRSFGIEALKLLSDSYAFAAQEGALDESDTKRSPGVRYNPRPARIIYILVEEANCQDLALIDDAIRNSSNQESFNLNYLASLTTEDFLRKPYHAAYLLDVMRHLHMRKDNQQPTLEKQLIDLEKLQALHTFAYWPRINTLLSAAISRSMRNLGKFARN